ncbi:MAG: methylmalonyl Co-A mutase-associated GTPase MeaB, partial [Rhodospirillales bacterium]
MTSEPNSPSQRYEKTVSELVDGVRAGDRAAIGRAVTLVESNNPSRRQSAQK